MGIPADFRDPAPPRHPRQDKSEKDLAGLVTHLGPTFLEAGKRKNGEAEKQMKENRSGTTEGTRKNWILMCSILC